MAVDNNSSSSTNQPLQAYPFGLSPSRVRGALALLLVILMFYIFIFESDPPPLFSEVEVIIPEQPQIDFDERTIMLPEFETSPLPDETVSDEDVLAIIPAESAPTLTIEAEEVEEPVAAAQPDPEPESAEPAAEPAEPAPEPAVVAVVPPPPGFFVQVAAFKSRDTADALLARLKEELKVPGYIQAIARGDSELYRVRLGSFGDDEAQAREVISRLRQYDVALSENAFVDEI